MNREIKRSHYTVRCYYTIPITIYNKEVIFCNLTVNFRAIFIRVMEPKPTVLIKSKPVLILELENRFDS